MRPIDADELMELYDFPPEYAEALSVPMPIVVQNILDMPTLDYAPVRHGKWKYYHKQNKAVCMDCSFERDLDADFGRAIACPNCGAKMDGKEDGKDD